MKKKPQKSEAMEMYWCGGKRYVHTLLNPKSQFQEKGIFPVDTFLIFIIYFCYKLWQSNCRTSVTSEDG